MYFPNPLSFMRDNSNGLAIIRSKPWKLPARPKVTIAIGIISKHKRHPEHKGGQIVLASDSQTTYPTGQKRLDAQKISVVRFADSKILIAQAGSAELADKAIEILKRKAKDIKIEDVETVPKAVQGAVREVRDYLIEINKGCNFTDDGWKRFFRDENGFNLLFGYYFEAQPYLCTVDIDWCLSLPVKGSFKAIGSGATLGEFLLKKYNDAQPDFEYSDVIATAVVEKVIQNVDGCGSPTWVGIARYSEESIAEGLEQYGYKDGTVLPKSTKCDAFVCRRQLTDAIAVELHQQEKISEPKKTKQLRSTLTSLCKKVGMLVYTDPGDPDGNGSARFFGEWNSEKAMTRSIKRQNKLREREQNKKSNKKLDC